MSSVWLDYARALKLGERRKIKHCGTTPSLSLQNMLAGYRGYCHRCSQSFFEPHSGMHSFAALEEYKRTSSQSKSISMPEDATTNFMADEPMSLLWMTWLARGGITSDLRKTYGLAWSKRYGKAVLPVYESSTSQHLSGVLLRRLVGNGPKYILDAISPDRLVFTSRADRASLVGSTGASTIKPRVDCVITEDVLSAIRVGEYLPATALLGTSLGQGKLDRVISASQKSAPVVGLWGDPDKAGQTLNKKLERSLILQGLHVVWISSEKDPKNLNNRDILRSIADDRYNPLEDFAPP